MILSSSSLLFQVRKQGAGSLVEQTGHKQEFIWDANTAGDGFYSPCHGTGPCLLLSEALELSLWLLYSTGSHASVVCSLAAKERKVTAGCQSLLKLKLQAKGSEPKSPPPKLLQLNVLRVIPLYTAENLECPNMQGQNQQSRDHSCSWQRTAKCHPHVGILDVLLQSSDGLLSFKD